jgi:hypothetical protein
VQKSNDENLISDILKGKIRNGINIAKVMDKEK